MKSACLFAALASSAAVAPPRISLNLEGMTSAYMLDKPIYRQHDLGLTNKVKHGQASLDQEPVLSRQDWTEKCPAKRHCPADQGTCETGGWVTTDAANCPFPTALAFDHEDRATTVQTRIFLIDLEGVAQNLNNALSSTSDVSFEKRATYLFKYDAVDKHMNHAEQVVFALILDDVEAPFFQTSCADGTKFSSSIAVEAASTWEMCESTVEDNVDGTVLEPVTYQVHYVEQPNLNAFQQLALKKTRSTGLQGSGSQDTWENYATTKDFLRDFHVGKYLVTAQVFDKAQLYGHNAENNRRVRHQTVIVKDTTAPHVELQGSSPVYVECSKTVSKDGNKNKIATTYFDEKNRCIDALDTETLGAFLPLTTTYHKIIECAANDAGCATYHADGTVSHVQDPAFVVVNDKSTKDRTYTASFANTFRKFGEDRAHDMPVTVRELEYTCDDFSGNVAAKAIRKIHTVDTEAPTITITDYKQHSMQFGSNVETTITISQEACHSEAIEKEMDKRVSAEDSCVSGAITVNANWGPTALNCDRLGHYVRTYTATDDPITNNVGTGIVNVIVYDDSEPQLSVKGDQLTGDQCLQASRTASYTDDGATCDDNVVHSTEDSNLDHAVEVSGDVVNMRVPGTYVIRYDCQDFSGNNAEHRQRKVEVCDSTKPVLSLLGTETVYVEAGFPYHDAGATATDTLDGDVTSYIHTEGNTIEAAFASHHRLSCDEIAQKNPYKLKAGKKDGEFLENGKYWIAGNKEVMCYFVEAKDGKDVEGFTYHVHEVPSANAQKRCVDMGMVKLENKGDAEQKNLFKYVQDRNPGMGNLDKYACMMKKAAKKDITPPVQMPHGESEHGKFIIRYDVADKEGNKATPIKRTVFVKDTLPPVITLKLNNKLIHNGGINRKSANADKYKDTGMGHFTVGEQTADHKDFQTRKSWGQKQQFNTAGADYENGASVNVDHPRKDFDQDESQYNSYNPAAYEVGNSLSPETTFNMKNGKGQVMSFGNNNLMAEATSTNGWLIGAVASAVAGVALLGLSTRKAPASVPV